MIVIVIILTIVVIVEGIVIGLLYFRWKGVMALASRDGLTDLYNRREFDRLLAEAIERAKNGGNLSLIMIDIDHFKRFNDKFGHQVGDLILRKVAKTLEVEVRLGNPVCRYGGEEIAVILPNADKSTAIAIAQRLRERVAAFKLCTISLGVACLGVDASSAEELVAAADAALYLAKNNGRNQVC